MDRKIPRAMDVAIFKMGIYDRRLNMYIGIDPGKDKTGWALVDKTGSLKASGIFRGYLPSSIAEIMAFSAIGELGKSLIEGTIDIKDFTGIEKIIVGSGTTSSQIISELSARDISPIEVDEKNTTIQARWLYWKIHRPGFLRRIFPFLLQLPPRDIDDLAAWQIVKVFLEGKEADL